jgi:hypothetical protein
MHAVCDYSLARRDLRARRKASAEAMAAPRELSRGYAPLDVLGTSRADAEQPALPVSLGATRRSFRASVAISSHTSATLALVPAEGKSRGLPAHSVTVEWSLRVTHGLGLAPGFA